MAARFPTASPTIRVIASFLLGGVTVLGFAPFALSPLAILTLAALFVLWNGAATARGAAALGFAFGLGLFGAGVSWVYIALSTFGGMPPALAAFATLVFCAYLALFPAATGWTCARLARPATGERLAVAAACWALTEWLRSWLLSGMPWLSIGYAQLGWPLAEYGPVGGVFLVGLATSATAALLAYAARASGAARRGTTTLIALGAVAALWAGGAALRVVEWTHPAGDPLAVSLLQGNVEQEIKFDPKFRDQTLELYADLVAQARGRLIVLPESALPMFADEVPPDYIAKLRDAALARRGDVLLGLFFFEPRDQNESEDHYFNSVVSLGTAPPQVYRKRHLVPFGETIPLKPLVGWFIRSVLHIPLADQTRGPAYQAPFEVAGEHVAVNICYEDAFGAELIAEAREATLLVNVTNDAWYGRSLAAEQHEQIAAFRALETGRPMLRSTNSGITSIIDHRGTELKRLPWFTRGVLEAQVTGRTGVTPYMRLGDTGAVVLSLAIAAAASLAGRRWRARQPV